MSRVVAVAMALGILASSAPPSAERRCVYQEALEATRDLYLRPLGQLDLLVELQTEGMDGRLSDGYLLVWVNVRSVVDCAPGGKPVVLRVSRPFRNVPLVAR